MIQSPFKFLDAYEKEDKDRFFGRAKETGQLYNAVHASNLVLVYGASGTGKTSLINCGLGNQFLDSDWLPLFVRRGTDQNQSLHTEVDRALGDGGDSYEGAITSKLRALYLEHYRPIYLIFDQFEELYILGTESEQQQFHETVNDLLRAGLQCKVLLVIREEYIAYLSEFEKVVPSLLDNRLRIEKMSDANLVRVIGGTAKWGGIELVEPRTTIERILENLRDKREGVDLTNLQVYLDRLWRADIERQRAKGASEPENVTFDPKLVEQVGKLANVLSDFLDEQLSEIETGLAGRGLAQPQGVPLEVLFTLVTEDGTKRPLDIAEVVEALPKNRGIQEADVLFCMEAFTRIKLLRQLAAE